MAHGGLVSKGQARITFEGGEKTPGVNQGKERDMKAIRWAVCVAAACTAVAVVAEEEAGNGNLIQNASFETPAAAEQAVPNYETLPDGWDVFSSSKLTLIIGRSLAHQGDQAIKLATQGQRNGNGGFFQIVNVTPGSDYTFEADVMNDPTETLKGSCYGELSIEWQDDSGAELERVRSKPWGPSLSKAQWQTMKVGGKAPARAASARIVVTLYDGPNASKGAMWVDDAKLKSRD
jgi:hypothetical protein